MDLIGALSHPRFEVQRLLELAKRWARRPSRRGTQERSKVRAARQLRVSEIDRLVAKYKAGATVFQLAGLFGITRQTVGQHLKRRGVDTTRPGLAPADVGTAAELYRQDWSLARIAERFDTSAETVRKRLSEAGVRMRNAHGREQSQPPAAP